MPNVLVTDSVNNENKVPEHIAMNPRNDRERMQLYYCKTTALCSPWYDAPMPRMPNFSFRYRSPHCILLPTPKEPFHDHIMSS